jgi:hypothetical protein
MKKQIKWRLTKLPTTEELRDLVKDKIISQEEAREILFNEETEEDIKNEDLKAEIKFLREVVEKLSDKKTIIETIQTVIPVYKTYPFYQPYWGWGYSGITYGNGYFTTTGTNIASGGTTYLSTGSTTCGASGSNSVNCAYTSASSSDSAFTDISTF